MNVSAQLNYYHGYFVNYGLILGKSQPWLFLQSTFPQTGADAITHLLFVFAFQSWLQVKHEIKNNTVAPKARTRYIKSGQPVFYYSQTW